MKFLVSVILAFAMNCAMVWAQGSTAQIHGTVQDSSGAAVPGAEVTAAQTETNTIRATTTGADGSYVLPNLPIGPYRVEVTKEGFTKYLQSGIVLQVNSDPAVAVALKVGAVTEQVTVEANAALVETRTTAVGAVIENQRIVELPLNGRNVIDLISLAGAAVSLPVVRTAWFIGLNPISVGGQAPFGTGYSLDGAYHLNYLTGTYMPIAFPDAVQEFKVETSGQTAERGAASSVSVVTRSGTNAFHGNLFEFIRNSSFGSAREYFSTKTSPYKRNQFGGTVGGPIKKNRLFFFGGIQETISHQNPGNSIAIVPTAAVMAGDWTTFAGAGCNSGSAKTLIGTRVNNLTLANNVNLFSGNRISSSAYVPPAVFMANKLLGTLQQDGITPDPCGRITYNTPNYESDRQYVGKIDYQVSDKQSVFLRLLATQLSVPNAFSLDPNMLNWGTIGYEQMASSYAFGDTYLINPNMIQSFRFAFNRTANTQSPNLAFSWCSAGVKMWCTENPQTIGNMAITGAFTMGSTSASNEYWMGTSYALNDDLNWVRGAHQMTFGGGAWQGRVNEFTHFASTGQTSFTGAVTSLGMADYFLGDLATFFQGLPNSNATRQNSVNLYFTDTWRVNSRLTFNFGIRWEPYLPQTVSNGQISAFDMGRFLKGVKSTVFKNAPAGFYFPGDPGFPEKSANYRQWKHFDPRGGIAWDPKGDGKMSIRASYTFGYVYVPGITREDQAGSNPWGGRTTLNSPAGGLEDPWQGFQGGNPFPYYVTPNVLFTPRGQFITTPYDLTTPTTYTWNVAIQRQFGASWNASATYLGSRVQHLYMNVPINYAQLIPGVAPVTTGCAATAINCNALANVDARRVLSLLNPTEGQYVGNMDQWDPSGTQRYNAMVLTLQHRLSRGMSMHGNWTWSHCTGYFQGFNTKSDQTVTAPNNPLFDKGNCDTDRRHVLNISAVAQTPGFSNHLVRAAATGWQLAAIYRFSSGTPLAVQDGTDRELTGINHQRPNLVLGVPVYGSSGPGGQYLNPAALSPQPLGTVGNLGWNSIVGPTYWGLDMALSREFRIRERHSLQIRADAFNITNSFVSNPASTANPVSSAVPAFVNRNSALFGQNLAAQSTRKMQFALKYSF